MTSRKKAIIEKWWRFKTLFLMSFVSWLIGLIATGCANFSVRQTFSEISTVTKQQNSHQLNLGVLSSVKREEMLSQPLDLQRTVQLALLNNRSLQASFQQLGIDQAKWVASGIWSNPSLHLSLHTDWSDEHTHSAESEMVISMDIADLLFKPKQQVIQKYYLKMTTHQIRAEVIDLISQTEQAYHQLVTDWYRIEVHRQIVLANEAATDFATGLFQAGNLTRLDFLQQTSTYQHAKLSLLTVEDDYRRSRERLNQLMGLWGKDINWQIQPPGLPLPLIKTSIKSNELSQIENQAVDANISLKIQKQEINLIQKQISLEQGRGLLPHFEIGLETASGQTERKIGPLIGFALPIFNRGQAQKSMLESRKKNLEHSYYQAAVEVRSRARILKAELISAKRVVDFYQNQVLPGHNQILEQQQLQYNSMQIGTIRLLEARQQLAKHQLDYFQAGYNYLIKASQLRQLLNGQLPSEEDQQLTYNNKLEIEHSDGVH